MNLLFITSLLGTRNVPVVNMACVGDEETCFAEVAKETFLNEAINEAILDTFKSRIDEISHRDCFHKDRYGVCWHFHKGEMKYLDQDTVEWIPIVHE